MDERMKQFAENGDINAFYQLIREDVKLLEHIDERPFANTPLHIAASAGQIPFVMEMMGLKPSFAWKLNPDGFSPIHLALQNRHIKLVCRLLQFDGNLVRVKGRKRITPLHYVVANIDNCDLLEKFLLVCPDSIADVTVQNETAMHIALKNDQIEAFKFIVRWLKRNCSKNASFNEKAVLNWEDDDGNTVLHIAVSKIETQAVSDLLTFGFGFVRVNKRNSEGRTAWDILEGQTQVSNNEIRDMLHNAGASSGSSLSTVTRSDYNAIDQFYTLIGEDVKLLEHLDQLPFVQTPLHIAASAGHIPFAMEMMGLKPSFARKLNPDGLSPIHLALQNGHIELVRRLLNFDGDLVRVKGKECLTPLHYVVKRGDHLYLLDEFLLLCPDSIIDVTVQNETALHIALKHNKLEAFQFFMGWLGNNSSENAEFNKKKVLNWRDNEGNTVLHILVSEDQTQAVRHFLSWSRRFMGGYYRCERFVDVNSKNLEDKTAWDMLQEDNREIRDMLRRAGAKPGSSLSKFNRYPNLEYQRPSTISFAEIFLPHDFRLEIRKITEERRNMYLVVAALLATLTFQAVFTPPGGLWQDNGLCITTEPGSSYHYNSRFNKTVGSSYYPKIIYLRMSNTTLACEHIAGTAIALDDGLFPFVFLVCNTALFSFSNSLIVVLIRDFYIKCLFLGLNIILCINYFYSLWMITDDPFLTIPLIIGAGICFVLVQLFSWKL